ncbi:hypothetical protein Hanom_Chr06g00513041 [Helianthus anomalus]
MSLISLTTICPFIYLLNLKNQMIGPSLFHEPSIARTVKIVDDSNAHGLNRMSNFTSLNSD